MNTGDRNTKGRAIIKGPRGGLYVVGPSGTKIRSFTKATAPPRVATPPRVVNTIKHRGSTYTNTNVTVSGLKVYRKVGAGTYYTISPDGTPIYLSVGASLTKPNGSSILLRNYKKTNGVPPVPAPRPRTTAGPRATSALPRITTAERNVRLAAIRARLNAMGAARRAAAPKKRANVDKRIKNVVARVRLRLAAAKSSRLNSPERSTLDVPFCYYTTASVPRKACKMRTASVPVYTSPLIDDGTALATRASDIDLDWFKRQDEYVKHLSDYDFWTAQAHTNRSHSWIGPFLYRGTIPATLPGRSGGAHTHIAPLWPQVRKLILDGTFVRRSGAERYRDAWIEDFKTMTSEKNRYDLFCNNTNHLPERVRRDALAMYRDDLKRIIAAAPKSRKKMVLYRGASFDIFKDRPGHWHTLTAFCSAAYNFAHSTAYGSTMQRITVLPGSPVLLVAGMNQWNREGEYEIMINVGTKYLIRTRDVRRAGWDGYRPKLLRVTDVTITK